MKRPILLGLAMAMSIAQPQSVLELKLREDFGYLPTKNKHIAKRQKRKLARRTSAATNPTKREYKNRNKKGRP